MCICFRKSLLILLINQIHHYLHHHVLLFRSTLGNHEGEGDKSIVGYSFVAIGSVEDTVLGEEPEEEHGGNALVAIAERRFLTTR